MPGGDANAERMQIALRRLELLLLQLATQITGDRERAPDVVQETFVKFQNNGAFQNPEPATWLFTVCRNGALNVCRKDFLIQCGKRRRCSCRRPWRQIAMDISCLQ